MAITAQQQQQFADDAQWAGLLRGLVVEVAIGVVAEDPATANHAARVDLAGRVLHQPTEWARRMLLGLLTDASVTAAGSPLALTVTPAQAKTIVATQWNAYAEAAKIAASG